MSEEKSYSQIAARYQRAHRIYNSPWWITAWVITGSAVLGCIFYLVYSRSVDRHSGGFLGLQDHEVRLAFLKSLLWTGIIAALGIATIIGFVWDKVGNLPRMALQMVRLSFGEGIVATVERYETEHNNLIVRVGDIRFKLSLVGEGKCQSPLIDWNWYDSGRDAYLATATFMATRGVVPQFS